MGQDPAMQDPAAGGMEGIEPAPDAAAGGYEICIKVTPDGQMSIGVEQPDPAAPEGAEGAYQPVQGMPDLLKQIQGIIQSGGKVADRAAEQQGFEQGFAG